MTRTFDRKREAERALSKILNEVGSDTFTMPDKITLDELLDEWLRSKRGLAANTISAYSNGVKPARERLGKKPARKVSVKDISDLLDWMESSGRKRGGKPGTGLGPRSQQITLDKLRAAYNWAAKLRLVDVNPAAMVDAPAQEKVKRVPWSPAEVKTFLAGVREDRLFAPMLLSLMGMRPAEVCGLRWDEDVDLDRQELTISNTRTIVWGDDGGRVVEKSPKTDAGERTLPLPAPVVVALKAFKTRQAKERLAGARRTRPAATCWSTSSASRSGPTSSGGPRTG